MKGAFMGEESYSHRFHNYRGWNRGNNMNEKKTSSITPSGPECLDEQCNIISTKWSP